MKASSRKWSGIITQCAISTNRKLVTSKKPAQTSQAVCDKIDIYFFDSGLNLYFLGLVGFMPVSRLYFGVANLGLQLRHKSNLQTTSLPFY
jgi:hypothetical protein